MPANDIFIEMGKPAPLARTIPKSKRRRGHYRLLVTVGASFLSVLLFLIFFSGSGNKGPGAHAKPGAAQLAGGYGGGSSTGSTGRNDAGGGGDGSTGSDAGSGAVTNGGGGSTAAQPPKVYTYKVVKEFPHDPEAFTQGLQYDRLCQDKQGGKQECRDVLWESTGLNGRSTVREVDLETGKVLRSKALPQDDFGEGLTRHGDRLYQVTWMGPRTWSYAVSDFEDAKELATPLRDGWGITSDGSHLVVGDSTDKLTWVDAGSMQSVRQVAVKDGGKPVGWLNELEYIDGRIWANIWQTDCIAHIDPASGAVTGWLRLDGLRERTLQVAAADLAAAGGGAAAGQREPPEVLNGVTYDAEQQRLFVTGKLWPRVYQIEAVEVPAQQAEQALARARRECVIHSR